MTQATPRPKFCRNCRHAVMRDPVTYGDGYGVYEVYEPEAMEHDETRCEAPQNVSLVTGVMPPRPLSHIRADESACGSTGKWFKPK